MASAPPQFVLVPVEDVGPIRAAHVWAYLLRSNDAGPDLLSGYRALHPALPIRHSPRLDHALSSASRLLGFFGIIMPATLPQRGQVRLVVVKRFTSTYVPVRAFGEAASCLVNDINDIQLDIGIILRVATAVHAEASRLFEVTATMANGHRVLNRLSILHTTQAGGFHGTIQDHDISGVVIEIVSVPPETVRGLPLVLMSHPDLTEALAFHALETTLNAHAQTPISRATVQWLSAELGRAKTQSQTTLLSAFGHEVIKSIFSLSATALDPTGTPETLTQAVSDNMTHEHLETTALHAGIHFLLGINIPLTAIPAKAALFFGRAASSNLHNVTYALFGFIADRISMQSAIQTAASLAMIPPILQTVQQLPTMHSIPKKKRRYVRQIKASIGRIWTHEEFANVAFNHGSPEMERQEFVGDFVLGFAIGLHFYRFWVGFPATNPSNGLLVRTEISVRGSKARLATFGDTIGVAGVLGHNAGAGTQKKKCDLIEALIGGWWGDSGEDWGGVVAFLARWMSW